MKTESDFCRAGRHGMPEKQGMRPGQANVGSKGRRLEIRTCIRVKEEGLQEPEEKSEGGTVHDCRDRSAPLEWQHSLRFPGVFFYLTGKFCELPCEIKKLWAGSHCGGKEIYR